jgi:hypothetical protein
MTCPELEEAIINRHGKKDVADDKSFPQVIVLKLWVTSFMIVKYLYT